MHILYIHQHFCALTGSSGTRSYEFARSLIRNGHSVTVICGDFSGNGLPKTYSKKWVEKYVISEITVLKLKTPYSNHFSFFSRALSFSFFAILSTIICLRSSYDQIIATSTPLTVAIPCIIQKLFRKKPYIFEVRDLWPELPQAMGIIKSPTILFILKTLEKSAYKNARKCIGLSPGIVKGIQSHLNTDTPVTMIPNGCDINLFTPISKKSNRFEAEYGLCDDDFIAVFSGAHGLANGLDAIIDVAEVLHKETIGKKIKFIFIGDGKLKPKLLDCVNKKGLTNCLFLPPIPKQTLAKLLPQMNIGLMTLSNIPAFYYGTSPNKFFDYLSAGLPIINNYPGWIAELIVEYDCGIAIEPNNPCAFAKAIVSIKENPIKEQQMGHNARILAKSQFDRNLLATQFCEFIQN